MIKTASITAVLLAAALFTAQAYVKPVVRIEEAFAINALAVTPDGGTIIAAASDGTIHQFTASSGRKNKPSLKLPHRIYDMAVTGEGRSLLLASDKVYIMSLADNSLRTVDAPRASVVAADRAGLFGAGASGYTITYYNLESGRSTLSFRAQAEIYAAAVDSAARMLYAAGKDGTVRAYAIPEGKLAWEYPAKIGTITSLALSGDKIIAGGHNGVRLISRTGADIKELARHTDTVRSVSITPDGRFAVTGGDDGIPVVWDTGSYRADSIKPASELPITAVAIDPYFRYAAAAGAATGDMGGMLTIQYTADKRETRRIYIFRDATLTLNGAGYADGTGTFGKYLGYEEGSRKYTFTEVAGSVHKPDRLNYDMPRPKISQSPVSVTGATAAIDTTPPAISLNERGFQAVTQGEITPVEGQITDESGVAWAEIDEKPLKLAPDGKFTTEVAVPESGKSITISAADVYGNSTEKTFVLGADKNKSSMGGRKVALLIGVNRYKHLPGLRTPEYGVRILGEMLRTRYGYEIIQLTGVSATRDGIMSEINRLRRALGKSDSLILYYAGHGYLDTETDNPYWQPYDADPSEDTRWILTSQITSALAAYAAGQILIISDSCYSGNATGYVKDGTNLRIVISAGGNEPVADIDTSGHSIFTGAMINALKLEPDDSEKLFELIKMNIPSGTKQKPQLEKLSGDGKYMLK